MLLGPKGYTNVSLPHSIGTIQLLTKLQQSKTPSPEIWNQRRISEVPITPHIKETRRTGINAHGFWVARLHLRASACGNSAMQEVASVSSARISSAVSSRGKQNDIAAVAGQALDKAAALTGIHLVLREPALQLWKYDTTSIASVQ